MPYLPNELLLQITRWLDPCEPEENETLRDLRLVCKFTNEIASEMLFKTVVMADSLERTENLVDALVNGNVTKHVFRVLICTSAMIPERKLDLMRARAGNKLSRWKRNFIRPDENDTRIFSSLLRRFFNARTRNTISQLVEVSLLLTSDLEEFPRDRQPWDDQFATVTPMVLNDYMIARVPQIYDFESDDDTLAEEKLHGQWIPFTSTEKAPNPLVIPELRLHAEHSSQLRRYGRHFLTFFAPTLSIFVGTDDADLTTTNFVDDRDLYTLQDFLDELSLTPCPFRSTLTLFGGYSTSPISFLKPTEYNSRLTVLKLQGLTMLDTSLLLFLSSAPNIRNVHLSYILLDETCLEWNQVFEVLKRNVNAFFFEGLHYQYGDPVYYWGDQAVTGYMWRRPLESHLDDDYTAFRMFTDGVLERRKMLGLPRSLYMDTFCSSEVCTKRMVWGGEEDEDDDVPENAEDTMI